MSVSDLRPVRRVPPLRRSRRSEDGCPTGRAITVDDQGRAGATPEVPDQHHGAGVTAVRVGLTRLLLVGSVKLEEADGRKRAIWKRGESRSSAPRPVGRLLRPLVDISADREGSGR
jgi:hypothetical protein